MSSELDIPFLFQPRPDLLCAGQPDEAGFRAAVASGVHGVVNLRPAAEMEWDEAALLASLGVDYLQIPVAGPADLSQDNARTLNAWMQAHAGQKVLVHCASSNRVGALLALGAFLQGSSADEALQLGRAAGLTRMEPLVQNLLGQWGQQQPGERA